MEINLRFLYLFSAMRENKGSYEKSWAQLGSSDGGWLGESSREKRPVDVVIWG